MNWDNCQLGDVLKVKHGFAFKSQFFEDQGPYVIMTPGNFFETGGFRSRPGKDRSYSGEIPNGYILQSGDVVVAMTEQGPGLLGSSAIVPEDGKYLHNQRIGLIHEVDDKRATKEFLYHLFNTRGVRAQIDGSATGTKVRHTAPERIYRVCVDLPPVHEQRRISSILKNYDDLIEKNRRRIVLLEEAARLLYREWFVHFRFPGHEHVKIVDGVPEGWEVKKVGELLARQKSKPKVRKDEYQDVGTYPCIDQGQEFVGGYTENAEAIYTEELPLIVFGDHTRALKFVNFPFARGADGTQLCKSNDPKLSQEMFYWALVNIDLSNYFYARHFKFLKDQEVVIPAAEFADQFTEFARHSFDQIRVLRQQSFELAKARDLLLPRLMDGRLEVAA